MFCFLGEVNTDASYTGVHVQYDSGGTRSEPGRHNRCCFRGTECQGERV